MTDQATTVWQHLDTEEFVWTIPPRLNIAAVCTDDQDGESCALVVDHRDTHTSYTFAELATLSRRFAQFLADRGLAAGDRVGVMIPQGVEVVTAHLGSYRYGAVTVPLSVKFGPEAVTFRLRHSGAKVLVIDAENFARIGEALGELSDLETVVVLGADSDVPATRDGIEAIAYSAILDCAPWQSCADTGPESPATIIYTSGTTGNPKGALHGHRILPAHMPGMRTTFINAPQPNDVFWTPADWAWIGGLFDVLFTALALGCTVVAAPDKYTPGRAIELMRRHHVTAAFIPPTALKHMRSSSITAADTVDLHMRVVATGGEVLGGALRQWFNKTFAIPINEFYGQTEMNMTIGTVIDKWSPEPDSMGRAFPGFEIAILGADDHPVSAGEVGEICVRAGNPGQFLCYWEQPDKTAEKLANGWIHTGDRGRMDVVGNVWYEGRADDVISTAGYRVGPGEIEECLMTHPAVSMAAAVGAPDELRGEAVHAFIVLTEGQQPSGQLAAQLQEHVKSRLAFYQYPREISFRDELPLTTTGKIMRRALRRELASEQSST